MAIISLIYQQYLLFINETEPQGSKFTGLSNGIPLLQTKLPNKNNVAGDIVLNVPHLAKAAVTAKDHTSSQMIPLREGSTLLEQNSPVLSSSTLCKRATHRSSGSPTETQSEFSPTVFLICIFYSITACKYTMQILKTYTK